VLGPHGAACSMSAAGTCYDNAVAESFFRNPTKELVHGCAFKTRSEAYDAISDYIKNYYKAKRRHLAAGNQSPSTSSWHIRLSLRHSHINNLSGNAGELHI
jgi:transposase InsO family protein